MNESTKVWCSYCRHFYNPPADEFDAELLAEMKRISKFDQVPNFETFQTKLNAQPPKPNRKPARATPSKVKATA